MNCNASYKCLISSYAVHYVNVRITFVRPVVLEELGWDKKENSHLIFFFESKMN